MVVRAHPEVLKTLPELGFGLLSAAAGIPPYRAPGMWVVTRRENGGGSVFFSECSSVWLEPRIWDAVVGGSNPSTLTPTYFYILEPLW